MGFTVAFTFSAKNTFLGWENNDKFGWTIALTCSWVFCTCISIFGFVFVCVCVCVCVCVLSDLCAQSQKSVFGVPDHISGPIFLECCGWSQVPITYHAKWFRSARSKFRELSETSPLCKRGKDPPLNLSFPKRAERSLSIEIMDVYDQQIWVDSDVLLLQDLLMCANYPPSKWH